MKQFLVSVVLLALVACSQAPDLDDVPLATTALKTYTASKEPIANPERGFYFHGGDCANNNFRNLGLAEKRTGTDRITLVLCIFYLKGYTDKPLDDGRITQFRNQAQAVRDAGLKMIVRFAYTEGTTHINNVETAIDAPVSRVLEHIGQLKSVLQENQDVIAVVESGFVGAWGEGYYSQNFGNNGNTVGTASEIAANWANRKLVVDELLKILPNRMVLVRTPRMKQAMYPRTTTGKTRVGHHNDCFLASDTDQGTWDKKYGPFDPSTGLTLLNPPRDSNNQPIDSDEHKNLAVDTRSVAMGGETCASNPRSTFATALYEMQKFHYSYLNRTGNKTVPDTWDTDIVNRPNLAKVKMGLGYRFELVSSEFSPTPVAPGTEFTAKITIRNSGWAAPINPRPIYLGLRRKDGLLFTTWQFTGTPLTEWHPGNVTLTQSFKTHASLPAGDYKLLLYLPDAYSSLANNPAYAIQMANVGTWEKDAVTGKDTGWNDLQQVLTVK